MNKTDILLLILLILFYAVYNIFATIIINKNEKLSRRLKIIIGIITWIIPFMAGIIIIQRYYPSVKKQPKHSGKKKKSKKR